MPVTVMYGQFMSFVEADDYTGLTQEVIASNLTDMVEISLILGLYRLRELAYRLDNRFTGRSPFTSALPTRGIAADLQCLTQSYSSGIIEEVLYLVFGETLPGIASASAPSQYLSDVRHEFAGIQSPVERQRITRDVSKTLPAPNSSPSLLIDADYDVVAQRNNVSLAAIKAIASVETKSSGFDAVGRPTILFEAHQFRKYTSFKSGKTTVHRYDKTHPHLSMSYPASRQFYRWDQYDRLYEALLLDPEAACRSASWGKFQVMGFNYGICGYSNAVSMAQDMFVSEQKHLAAFEHYCSKRGVFKLLRDKNWREAATAYNGSDSDSNDYATKLGKAYERLGGK